MSTDDLRRQFRSIGLDFDGCAAMGRLLMGGKSMDQKDPTIDTIMYLRDGAPRATVCKLQMKDGRIGIGIYRNGDDSAVFDQDDLDHLAFCAAVDQLPAADEDEDLQASLGHPAHE